MGESLEHDAPWLLLGSEEGNFGDAECRLEPL
jgi:hypothetical protein